jgi:hypothetical protein
MATVLTQFSVVDKTKNRLDRYKAENKEKIIAHLKLDRRMVSNTHAIEFLLDQVKAPKR